MVFTSSLRRLEPESNQTNGKVEIYRRTINHPHLIGHDEFFVNGNDFLFQSFLRVIWGSLLVKLECVEGRYQNLPRLHDFRSLFCQL